MALVGAIMIVAGSGGVSFGTSMTCMLAIGSLVAK